MANVKVKEIEPALIRHQDAVNYCGKSPTLVESFVSAGWLKPIIQQRKRTIYRLEDVQIAVGRLENEGLEALAIAARH